MYIIYSDTNSGWNPSLLVSISVCGSKFTSACNQNGKSQQLPLWLYERVWEFSVSQYLSLCVLRALQCLHCLKHLQVASTVLALQYFPMRLFVYPP